MGKTIPVFFLPAARPGSDSATLKWTKTVS